MERKEFEAKEIYDMFIKELKDGENKLQAALSLSFKYIGKLQTMKETRWVSPQTMIAGLKNQGEKMQRAINNKKFQEVAKGIKSNLAYGAINNKKFQEVAKGIKKCLEEWQGFKDSISKPKCDTKKLVYSRAYHREILKLAKSALSSQARKAHARKAGREAVMHL